MTMTPSTTVAADRRGVRFPDGLFAVLILALIPLAGCAGPGGYEFREALVLYRSAVRPGEPAPVFIGFVNASHPRYVHEGNVREEVPGAKALDDETTGECLGRLADLGYPKDWIPAGDISTAIQTRPRDHILVAEVDGKVHLLIRGAAAGDAESRRHIMRFVDSKRILVDRVGYRAGYRIIRNKEGAKLFEKQREKIGEGGGGKRR
jgi:hypothetical protein